MNRVVLTLHLVSLKIIKIVGNLYFILSISQDVFNKKTETSVSV